ncbi:MAG: ABC transporter substrate-binding protein, partial [Rubrivivax sp.]
MHDFPLPPRSPRRRSILAGALAAGSLLGAAPLVQAQSGFPSQPVRVIVPFGPG